MTSGNVDISQGDGGGIEPPPPPTRQNTSLHGGEKVYKSGPLFLSSKGIGWTSWKKRWFILTRTSLIFFRNDPNVPQKGTEVNLTLGGIDLNSSGSVVVKEDKKLLTVLFPDGRDGRAFTLKAETLEDLHEWKFAIEEVLLSAPNSCLVSARNGILRSDHCDAVDVSSEQLKDRKPEKSMVLGRPILLALEDIDGTPSFLEKALRFLEEHGVKIEGILRQAADVEDVERRIREYEKGKTEFSPQEDPHVIGDCIKYVLRELPSSPVPASCCNALLEACRTDRGIRVNAVRSAICETFPEPNRRILQRILLMMQRVASNKAVNRMSTSAVAACMAPLLLRPLLAGDCDLENDFDMGGDGSVQLLKAAAAANHAQAVVITLLEEYENIFGEGSVSPEPYTDSEESETESEETTDDDDDDSFDDDRDDDVSEIAADDVVDVDENFDHESSVTSTETDENEHTQQVPRSNSSRSKPPQEDYGFEASQTLSLNPPQTSLLQHDSIQGGDIPNDSCEFIGVDNAETSRFQKGSQSSYGPAPSAWRPTVWGRAPARKNLSMESIALPPEDQAEFEKLESLAIHFPNGIANEAMMQDDLERRKHELHERRLVLEKDVERLQEQLQKEMKLRTALEARCRLAQQTQSVLSVVDEKADLEEIAQAEEDVSSLMQKADDLELQLNQQREQNSRIRQYLSIHLHQSPNHQEKPKEKQIDGRAIDIANTSENSSRSKHDPYLEKPGVDKDKTQESPPSLKKTLTQNQQVDSLRNKHAIGVLSAPSIAERGTNRSSLRGEGGGTALSKLSNRLNFLRERRSQIAKELQNLDKGRNSSHVLNQLEQQARGSELERSRDAENSGLLLHDPEERNSDGIPPSTNSR